MTTALIKRICAHLIVIGQSTDPDDPANADTLQKIHDFSRGQPTFVGGRPRFLLGHPRFFHKWQDLVGSLAIGELAALIKGYAFCEERFRWSGGCRSPVIEMFRFLNKRVSPKVADEVADWILSRNINECLPYGVNKRGAQSAKEFRKKISELIAFSRQRLAEEAESARQRTIDRARRKAQRFASARDRNSYIREKLKDDLSRLAVEDQLQRLIDDQEYSVEFYPTCLAGVTTHNVIESLEVDLKSTVLERLKGKHRGPWGGLKKRLLVSFHQNSRKRRRQWQTGSGD